MREEPPADAAAAAAALHLHFLPPSLSSQAVQGQAMVLVGRRRISYAPIHSPKATPTTANSSFVFVTMRTCNPLRPCVSLLPSSSSTSSSSSSSFFPFHCLLRTPRNHFFFPHTKKIAFYSLRPHCTRHHHQHPYSLLLAPSGTSVGRAKAGTPSHCGGSATSTTGAVVRQSRRHQRRRRRRFELELSSSRVIANDAARRLLRLRLRLLGLVGQARAAAAAAALASARTSLRCFGSPNLRSASPSAFKVTATTTTTTAAAAAAGAEKRERAGGCRQQRWAGGLSKTTWPTAAAAAAGS